MKKDFNFEKKEKKEGNFLDRALQLAASSSSSEI